MKRKGFTLIELMIVVAIIAILASIAIPQYKKFQLKAKTSEAKSNIGAIRSAEETYAAEHDVYHLASPTPSSIPGATASPWPSSAPGFDDIGFKPAGNVYYTYWVNTDSSNIDSTSNLPSGISGTTTANDSLNIYIAAKGDLDGNGTCGAFYATDEDPKIVDVAPGKF